MLLAGRGALDVLEAFLPLARKMLQSALGILVHHGRFWPSGLTRQEARWLQASPDPLPELDSLWCNGPFSAWSAAEHFGAKSIGQR
jgi:hypothetical protein